MSPSGRGEGARKLQEPESRAQTFERKALLREVYRTWYSEVISDHGDGGLGVELGSATRGIKSERSDVFCSDIHASPYVDFVGDGLAIPLRDSSIARFVMINVFHHVADSRVFLEQLLRALEAGGRIVMIEPFNTLAGRFVWGHLHHEPFEPSAQEWIVEGKDPLMSANSALPWIVFVRDHSLLETEFAQIRIDDVKTHTCLGYLLSGGFSRPQVVPAFLSRAVVRFDGWLCRVFPSLGLFATIRLRKVSGPARPLGANGEAML